MGDNSTHPGGDEPNITVQDASCTKRLLDAINNPEAPLTFASYAVTQDVGPGHQKQERTVLSDEGESRQSRPSSRAPTLTQNGHPDLSSEVIMPRTDSQLDRHIDQAPEMIKSMEAEPPPDKHNFTTSFTVANTHAALHEAFRVLGMPEHLAVLTNIVRTEAGVVAKQAATPEGLHASRLTAKEAFIGSYDAVEEKYGAWVKGLPGYTMPLVYGVGAFVAFFLLGVFMAVWRFVLYGLQ